MVKKYCNDQSLALTFRIMTVLERLPILQKNTNMYKNQEQFVIKSEAWSRWDSFAKPQTLISLDTSMFY